MGKGQPSTPTIITPQAPTKKVKEPIKELGTAEQKRRARISDTKKQSNNTLLGASSESDKTSLLKMNILGV